MSITISNDYPTFKITDNLHQLVDRLGIFTDAVDSNFRVMDSSLNDVLAVVHRDSALIQADNDLTITANNLTLQVDSDLSSNCYSWDLNTTSTASVRSGGAIRLMSHFDAGNVQLLGDNGLIYGIFNNHPDGSGNANLKIHTGVYPAVTFERDNSIFPGTITMPSSGTGSPYTEAKTVSGAINELHEELVQITDVELDRIVELEKLTSQHTTTINSHTTTLASHDTRIQVFEGLNISNRLKNIENRLDDVERRLGLLGV